MSTYRESDAARHILLASTDGGEHWQVANISGGSDDATYREADAVKVILLKSEDGGVTWTPVEDPASGGSGGGGDVPNPLVIADDEGNSVRIQVDGAGNVYSFHDGPITSETGQLVYGGDFDDGFYAFAQQYVTIDDDETAALNGLKVSGDDAFVAFWLTLPFTTSPTTDLLTTDTGVSIYARQGDSGVELVWVEPDGTEHIFAERTP